MLAHEPQGGDRTGDAPATPAPEETSTARKATTRRRTRAKAPAAETTAAEPAATGADASAGEDAGAPAAAAAGSQAAEASDKPVKKAAPRRRRRAADDDAEPAVAQAAPGAREPVTPVQSPTPAAAAAVPATSPAGTAGEPAGEAVAEPPARRRGRGGAALPPTVLFMAPEPTPPAAAGAPEPEPEPEPEPTVTEEAPRRRRRGRRAEGEEEAPAAAVRDQAAEPAEEAVPEDESEDEEGRRRRRRGRRGRGRGKGPADEGDDAELEAEAEEEAEEEPLTRRRRRRRRKGAGGEEGADDDGVPTVVRIREPRKAADEVQGVTGSTRLEAKRQRRRDGRDQRRTRPPILTESEFLARREAVDRVMAVRQVGDRTQIAVLEDDVLVEHYVTRSSSATMVGNVYLGKVQNVLPSMEAAFVDVGRGRNAVLYAGEVNWDASGLEGRARSIEQALRPGDPVLVQVTKDPIGHKGARLTSHVALSGRHLVYVPHGNASGISRKLPDTERKRLRDVLKKLVPESAGVIVRTAAEGASEDELARDITRLQAQWEDIESKSRSSSAPALLYAEPDLVIRVVRDLFNEDFRELVIQGDAAYDEVSAYLSHVSPDLVARLSRHTGTTDVFAARRIDEQILKGLDRKVYLPSGGHLVIDRTEAMTVVDVNTGKYTGAGGNLEETVTRNNLEAAEEIVRQLRLRDLGGIVVIDFIDMVLESNRELVLRRLTECLGRDRTKHQVTEITSLGLVQMTRKRIGAGLLEAFSETCEHCKGRGLVIHPEPVAEKGRGGGEKVRVVASAGAKPEGGGGRRRGRKAAAAAEAPTAEADAAAEAATDADTGQDAPVPPREVAAAAEPAPTVAQVPSGRVAAAGEPVGDASAAAPAVSRTAVSAPPPAEVAAPVSAAVSAGLRTGAPGGAAPASGIVTGSSGIVSPAAAVGAVSGQEEDRFAGYDLSRFEDEAEDDELAEVDEDALDEDVDEDVEFDDDLDPDVVPAAGRVSG